MWAPHRQREPAPHYSRIPYLITANRYRQTAGSFSEQEIVRGETELRLGAHYLDVQNYPWQYTDQQKALHTLNYWANRGIRTARIPVQDLELLIRFYGYAEVLRRLT